ncbi:MAG: phosphotransacetylase family protein [Deltaproteobacteria bacterium]|nr:phosphotransacetylase family protein [Deltaproteobacteria bacterium]
MTAIFIGSTIEDAGKDILTLGLGKRFKDDGYRLSFFKPVGIHPVKVQEVLTDQDAWTIYRFLELDQPLESLCPVVVTHDLLTRVLQGETGAFKDNILATYKALQKDRDILMMTAGGSIYSGGLLGTQSIGMINEYGVKVIIIDRYTNEFVIDRFLEIKDRLGDNLLGVVINRVNDVCVDEVKGLVIPFLNRRGIEVLGVLPEDPIIRSISVSELNSILGGTVLTCQERLHQLVENFIIGGMQVDHARKYMNKIKNAGVIVGGDRTDILAMAIEMKAQCLILTGSLYPNEMIMTSAEQKGVPIILTRDDTYTVARRVDNFSSRLQLREKEKVDRGLWLVGKHFDFDLFYRLVGLGR